MREHKEEKMFVVSYGRGHNGASNNTEERYVFPPYGSARAIQIS